MSAFVQSYAPPMGDFGYGSHLEVMSNTPYLTIPTSTRMSTASPMSGSNTAYQSTPNQIPDNSFFDEALDRSSASIEAGFASPYIPSPIYSLGSNMTGDHGTPHYTMPIADNDKRASEWLPDRRGLVASSVFSEINSSPVVASKPKKRGRKPKKQPKEQAGLGLEDEFDDEFDDDDLPKDPRRRRILERNRIAATKCRLRKRDEASALASREQAMEDQNRYLSNCFDSLTAEIYHLKTQLLRHTDCNCVLIQRYITNEAKKSVDGLLACSSSFHQYGDSLSPEYMSSGGTSGSSSGSSTTESLNLHSPGSDGVPPAAWPVSFQPGVEPFQKAAMPRAHYPTVPIAECGQGLYISMGPQEHQIDSLSWDNQWEFR